MSKLNVTGNDLFSVVQNIKTKYLTPAKVGVGDGLSKTENLQGITLKSVPMQSITWANLKSKRDNSQLVAGQWYRITDYVTTSGREDWNSAGHQFDVIVLATASDKLSEEARATKHSGDTYFTNAGSNLEGWKIWYCLDNDTTRFDWADSTNGKGVIYRMIDEFRNDCPYDFKNIMFKPGATSAGTIADVFYYTFSVATGTNDATVTDHSLNGACCYGNKVGVYVENNKQKLPSNVFRNTTFSNSCHSNTFGNSCYSNTFGNGCKSNTFGYDCYENTFGNYCGSNTFGNGCYSNTFGDSCHHNTFGNNCYYNTFGNGCGSNTFGNGCYSNTFGVYCESNTFGDYCGSNTFGDYCNSNTFGNYCESNTFGDYCNSNTFEYYCGSNTFGNGCAYNTFWYYCQSNTFGDDCYSNTFGDACESNTFGNGCESNTFGGRCQYNTFGEYCYKNAFGVGCKSNTFGNGCESNRFGNSCSSNTFGDSCSSNMFGEGVQFFIFGSTTGATTSAQTKDYVRNVIVENGVEYVNAYITGSTGSSNYCQNVRICLGVKGTTYSNRKEIDITSCIGSTVNNVYQPAGSNTTSV